jgi:hypothetical protein
MFHIGDPGDTDALPGHIGIKDTTNSGSNAMAIGDERATARTHLRRQYIAHGPR